MVYKIDLKTTPSLFWMYNLQQVIITFYKYETLVLRMWSLFFCDAIKCIQIISPGISSVHRTWRAQSCLFHFVHAFNDIGCCTDLIAIYNRSSIYRVTVPMQSTTHCEVSLYFHSGYALLEMWFSCFLVFLLFFHSDIHVQCAATK